MNKSLIIFGIVNITSDSFSDGGRYLAPDAAIAQARKLMAEGADVIDLGPASSNPDAAPVSSDTEIARAYRAGAGRAQGRWHSRLARQLSTRDASLCLVAWCGLSQ
ncbi:hypothetical protein VEV11M_45580 (plasmid) [Escherichia coli]|nr:hypothetical protein VEV11M_45580 [Escherichia coli]